MEQLRLAIQIWGTGGILMCIITYIIFIRWQKKLPTIGTEKASRQEDLKLKMLIIGFLTGMIVYVFIGMIAFASVTYNETPWYIYTISALFIIGAISFFVSSYRNK